MTAVAHIQRAIETHRAQSPQPLSPATEHFALQLVAEGSILTLPTRPAMRYLVGSFHWFEPHRIFWFTAYGDSAQDAHVLEFDDTQMVDAIGLGFLCSGQLVGYLTRIEDAGLEDPDDYRVAWQLWQEVAPLRARLIEQCCAAMTGDARPT